jgi:hypothetical protein
LTASGISTDGKLLPLVLQPHLVLSDGNCRAFPCDVRVMILSPNTQAASMGNRSSFLLLH